MHALLYLNSVSFMLNVQSCCRDYRKLCCLFLKNTHTHYSTSLDGGVRRGDGEAIMQVHETGIQFIGKQAWHFFLLCDQKGKGPSPLLHTHTHHNQQAFFPCTQQCQFWVFNSGLCFNHLAIFCHLSLPWLQLLNIHDGRQNSISIKRPYRGICHWPGLRTYPCVSLCIQISNRI